MSFFTLSGNKLAATVIAAGAFVVTGTGVAVSLPGDRAVQVSENEQQPTVAATESPEPAPAETEEPPSEYTEESDSPESTPVGPDATGPAAFGLCNAYTNGGLKNSKSTA